MSRTPKTTAVPAVPHPSKLTKNHPHAGKRVLVTTDYDKRFEDISFDLMVHSAAIDGIAHNLSEAQDRITRLLGMCEKLWLLFQDLDERTAAPARTPRRKASVLKLVKS